MSIDERPESLAAQAAAWVPPWGRSDTAVPGAESVDADTGGAEAPDAASGGAEAPDAASGGAEPASGSSAEGGSTDAPAELPPLPGEATSPPTVDAPQPLPDDDEIDPLDPAIPAPDAPPAPGSGDPDGAPVDAPVDAGEGADEYAGEQAPVRELLAMPTAPAQSRGSRDASPPADPVEHRTVDEPAPIDDRELRAALEAILLVVDEPVADVVLAQVLEQPTERVGAMLAEISADYSAAGRGFDLRRAAGGWRLYTRPEYATYVERFVLDGQSVRLTQAALETLAVIAYKQPVTRSRISAIRGVNCDGVVRTLVTRGLIEECGTEPETGAYLYRTTTLFLEKLGLDSVEQLPPLAPFLPDDLEEVLDAQR